ncbi:MAG: TonB family protein [Novosphingobium sp.]|nr:TonB family protein [Novosphingobium sp.]
MAYADQQTSGNRVVVLIIVALLHVALAYGLITGLAFEAVKKVAERVTTIDIEEEKPPEEPPPPPPERVEAPPPVAPPPPIRIATAPPKIETVQTPPPPAPVLAIPTAPPPPPPPKFTPKPPQPKGMNRWAARIQENYPTRAVREGTEGTVGVRVSVDAGGRVQSCSVTSSSGSSDLDDAACKGMERYARFDPATDGNGEATSGSYSTRIVYRLN